MTKLIFVNRVCWPAEEATALLLTDLVEALADRGWDCHVVTASPGPGTKATPSGPKVSFHRTRSGSAQRKTRLFSKALDYLRYAREAAACVEDLAQEGDTVVVMTDPPLCGTRLAKIALRRRAQVVHWAQDIYPEVAIAVADNPILGSLLALLKPYRDRGWSMARGIITIGEDMAALIRQRVGANPPVTVVPNWAPSSSGATASPNFREAWGVPRDALLMVYAGNLGRAHVLDPLVEMADRLHAWTDVRLAIVGSGAHKTALQEEVRKRRLTNVSFHASVAREHLGELLRCADVHLLTLRPACSGTVLPSKFYGIAAAHRPMVFIGPRESEFARLITQKNLGAVCSPTELEPAIAYLIRMAEQPEHRLAAREPVSAFAQCLPGPAAAAAAWEQILRAD